MRNISDEGFRENENTRFVFNNLEIKQYQKKSGYNTCGGWTQIEYQNKHYSIDQKDERTFDDRRRDEGTNFILRIKEQETRLTLQEHHDDDFFSENHAFYEIMWKNIVETGRPRDNTAHAPCMLCT